MIAKAKITVVIVTYNGSKWLYKLLQTVIDSSIDLHIIVIDNASTDNSVAIIEKFSEVHLIKSAINLGFGKANNLGIKLALEQQSDFVFLLNQDTWVFKQSIENLVQAAQQYPEIGVLSPMHLSCNEINLDTNFETYYKRSYHAIDNKVVEVPFVNAAAWLVSAKCLQKVGFFEPLFNHYGEDRNFCDRVLYHKFKIGILKSASIVHDRIISKNFNKMVLQSEYTVLNSLLNINTSLLKSTTMALKNVFGLPKFFYKEYKVTQITRLCSRLLVFFVKTILHYNEIKNIRIQSKKGTNGL